MPPEQYIRLKPAGSIIMREGEDLTLDRLLHTLQGVALRVYEILFLFAIESVLQCLAR